MSFKNGYSVETQTEPVPQFCISKIQLLLMLLRLSFQIFLCLFIFYKNLFIVHIAVLNFFYSTICYRHLSVICMP